MVKLGGEVWVALVELIHHRPPSSFRCTHSSISPWRRNDRPTPLSLSPMVRSLPFSPPLSPETSVTVAAGATRAPLLVPTREGGREGGSGVYEYLPQFVRRLAVRLAVRRRVRGFSRAVIVNIFRWKNFGSSLPSTNIVQVRTNCRALETHSRCREQPLHLAHPMALETWRKFSDSGIKDRCSFLHSCFHRKGERYNEEYHCLTPLSWKCWFAESSLSLCLFLRGASCVARRRHPIVFHS